MYTLRALLTLNLFMICPRVHECPADLLYNKAGFCDSVFKNVLGQWTSGHPDPVTHWPGLKQVCDFVAKTSGHG